MIADVASIHREHLPRHSLIATQAAFAMFNETFTRCVDCDLACIRPIDARGKLAFDANPKCIGSFLVGKVLALAIAPAVVLIDKPSCFGFAIGVSPTAFANRGHLAFLSGSPIADAIRTQRTKLDCATAFHWSSFFFRLSDFSLNLPARRSAMTLLSVACIFGFCIIRSNCSSS